MVDWVFTWTDPCQEEENRTPPAILLSSHRNLNLWMELRSIVCELDKPTTLARAFSSRTYLSLPYLESTPVLAVDMMIFPFEAVCVGLPDWLSWDWDWVWEIPECSYSSRRSQPAEQQFSLLLAIHFISSQTVAWNGTTRGPISCTKWIIWKFIPPVTQRINRVHWSEEESG